MPYCWERQTRCTTFCVSVDVNMLYLATSRLSSAEPHTFNPSKYTNRYLAEFTCHFNRRFDLVATVTQLLRTVVNTNPLSLSKLRVSKAGNYSIVLEIYLNCHKINIV